MLARGPSYEAVRDAFRWRVPERYNIGVDVCDRHADGSGRLALVLISRTSGGRCGASPSTTLNRAANRLANALAAHGLARGDRVGVLLPQAPETAIAHLAAYKAGADRGAAVRAVRPGRARVPARAIRGAGGAGHRRGDLAKVAGDPRPACRTCARLRRSTARRDGTLDFHAELAPRRRRLRAGRHRGRRPGGHHLHLGHDRPAQGRAARAPRPARATCPASSCRTSSSRSPATCSGRRPTGPGSAACSTCCCRPGTTACRCWRTAARKFDPERGVAR